MVEVGHKVQMGLQLLSHRVIGTGREKRTRRAMADVVEVGRLEFYRSPVPW